MIGFKESYVGMKVFFDIGDGSKIYGTIIDILYISNNYMVRWDEKDCNWREMSEWPGNLSLVDEYYYKDFQEKIKDRMI